MYSGYFNTLDDRPGDLEILAEMDKKSGGNESFISA